MKFKEFIKENYKIILLMILIILFFNIKLPYYILAPGGTINITNRVVMEDYKKEENGSINMLYVSEYDGTPASLLMAKIKNYDIESNKERQISNETIKEINKRNKIMRDNSLDIATMVAYTEAGKKIDIKNRKNIVVATTIDNGLEIGDEILTVDNVKCEEVIDIKKQINSKEENDTITFKILRENKEKEIKSKVLLEGTNKIVGAVIITEYDYEIDPQIDIKFKNSESGASGGLMLALTIYNAITEDDIIKGRTIAGTGTISFDGTVGEIDGIKYKIMGAAKNKVDIVFVPSANYEEAVMTKNKYKYNLEIVRVDTFKEAIEYLENN
ncbi:MAG: S16 family serine protease [Bacilli bacterium]